MGVPDRTARRYNHSTQHFTPLEELIEGGCHKLRFRVQDQRIREVQAAPLPGRRLPTDGHCDKTEA